MIAQTVSICSPFALHAGLWSRGDQSERGVIIVIHGLGDHGGRWQRFAQRMIRRRWAVLAVDLPGHGRSPGRRGAIQNYDAMLETVASCRIKAEEHIGDKPQFLLGHSMGGNFVVNYLIRRQEFDPGGFPPPAGSILAAPMLMPPKFLDRSKVFAAWATGQLFRWIYLTQGAQAEKLVHDPIQQELLRSDPLQHNRISLYLATQLLAQGRFALDHAGDVDRPTLIIQGDEDELIDRVASEHLALRMRSLGKFVGCPGQRHDLLNDRDAEPLADMLDTWMGEVRTELHQPPINSLSIQGRSTLGTEMVPSTR